MRKRANLPRKNLRACPLYWSDHWFRGIGSIHSGEGVFGLKRSFVLSGAQTLILSLWKIPDETTRELMTRFYSLLSSGLTKSEALRKTRLEIRAK
ncbi:MAG TPA: CHAT domain-containing protein [Acidobacteriota bacterium]